MAFKIRLNGALRGTPHVRVIAASGEMLGVLTLAEALRMAMQQGLDLVEVNPSAEPPVCKLMDFSRYKAEGAKPRPPEAPVAPAMDADEAETRRENLLYGMLVREDVPAALAEAESWSYWPTDDIGLWLLVEAFFQSRRLECVPILERMLRTRSERDELSVTKMEEMIAIAGTWS